MRTLLAGIGRVACGDGSFLGTNGLGHHFGGELLTKAAHARIGLERLACRIRLLALGTLLGLRRGLAGLGGGDELQPHRLAVMARERLGEFVLERGGPHRAAARIEREANPRAVAPDEYTVTGELAGRTLQVELGQQPCPLALRRPRRCGLRGRAGPAERTATSRTAAPPAAAAAPEGEWAQLLAQLDLQGAARQLASHCVLIGRDGARVRLALDPRSRAMRTGALEEKLAQALSRHYGETVRLEFVVAPETGETPAQAQQRAEREQADAARQAFESDPGVRGFREQFAAEVMPETIRPQK